MINVIDKRQSYFRPHRSVSPNLNWHLIRILFHNGRLFDQHIGGVFNKEETGRNRIKTNHGNSILLLFY